MVRYLAVVLILAGACHKRAGKEFFGTQVAPPGILAQVRPGMTLEQLRAIAPELKDDPGRGYLLAAPASNVKLYAIVIDDLVVDPYVSLEDDHGMDVLTAAWGPPDAEKDREDPNDPAWRSTVTGWRAHVFCGHGTKETPLPPFCTISFRPHKPLEAMFGKAIAPPSEFAKARLGMPLAALKAATNLRFADDKVMSRALDFDGAHESAYIVEGVLHMLNYTVPIAARAMIDKAWGPATVSAEGETIWSDASTGWSVLAKVDETRTSMTLDFVGYQPFDKTVDLLVALASFKSVAEARAAHPELDWRDTGRTPWINLPCNELNNELQRAVGNTTMVNTSTNGRLFFSMMLDLAKEADVVTRLTTRWGAPKVEKSKPGGDESVFYTWHGHATLLREGTVALGFELGDR